MLTKRHESGLAVFLDHSTEKNEVKTMELAEKHDTRPAQSWVNRAYRKGPSNVDYCSELRSWLQHAILEAEKNKDSNKKDELLVLLKGL